LILTSSTSVALQGVSGKDSPKKGDKTDRSKSPAKAAKAEPKKAAGDEASSPKTESKLKKRGEVELEGKFVSKWKLCQFVLLCNYTRWRKNGATISLQIF